MHRVIVYIHDDTDTGKECGQPEDGLVMGCSYEVDQPVSFPRIDLVLQTARSQAVTHPPATCPSSPRTTPQPNLVSSLP